MFILRLLQIWLPRFFPPLQPLSIVEDQTLFPVREKKRGEVNYVSSRDHVPARRSWLLCPYPRLGFRSKSTGKNVFARLKLERSFRSKSRAFVLGGELLV